MRFSPFALADDVARMRITAASLSAGCFGMLLMLVHALAWGHATQLSSSQVTVGPQRAQVVLELNGLDIDVALKSAVVGEDGNVSEPGLSAAREALTAYVLEHTQMTMAPGADCRGEVGEIRPKAEHVLVDVEWSCPSVEGELTYRVTLFHEIDPASRHMVTALGEVKMVGLLAVSNPQVRLVNERSNVWRVMWHYLLAGIEHIAIGYDHIAFLIAVIVWGRKLWPLVMGVTAFTIAHSITLSLAVLDLVRLPSQLVETLIALSIVYVAAENFFVRDLR
ncbi:MAG: HupE/UreJ family protein, partial [Burkholderiales bacterium]|nr:HupE/UreJ family protein [Burkholderiales bacterium]